MTAIDLYISAIESINTVAMVNSMFTFALIVAICGAGGAFIIRGLDLIWEGLSFLDHMDYWWAAHETSNDINPEPCVVTYEMMMEQEKEFKPYGDIIRAAMNAQTKPTTITLDNVLGKMDMEYCIAGWFDELPEIMTMEDFEDSDVLTDEEFWADFDAAEEELYGHLYCCDLAGCGCHCDEKTSLEQDELEYLMEVPEPVTLLAQEDEWMDELMDRIFPANDNNTFAKYMRIC